MGSSSTTLSGVRKLQIRIKRVKLIRRMIRDEWWWIRATMIRQRVIIKWTVYEIL